MKKVLLISSSPRKNGNSDLLCDQFRKGASDAGHRAEKIFLAEKKIHYCTGCGACANATRPCVQKDDVAEILEKMIASDVIVLGTPVYFYTMCGQMKTFIDRCCARYTHITGKEFYYIMTAADGNSAAMDRVIEEFRGFLCCLDGAEEKGFICATGVWQKGDINLTPYPQAAFDSGKNI